MNSMDNHSRRLFQSNFLGISIELSSKEFPRQFSKEISSHSALSSGKQLVPPHLASKTNYGIIGFLEYAKRLHSSGKSPSEIEDILMKAAESDANPSVRENANPEPPEDESRLTASRPVTTSTQNRKENLD